MTAFDARNIIEKFDKYLEKMDLQFEAVIIGGAALRLMSVIKRGTHDVDVLKPSFISKELEKVSKEFALKNLLPENWLNCGPTSLTMDLPDGWESRLQDIFKGSNIKFQTLGRQELILSKAWAYCDRERFDGEDLINLKPTTIELEVAKKWVCQRDGNPDWPKWVEFKFKKLEKMLKVEKGIGR